MKKCISLFMDVEDPINPLADDAALEVAKLFTSCGVRGSFCLTGEKCRTLAARGRTDVARALLPHALGLHTDTHSFHPTTMELLETVSYAEGCELALQSESKGFDAFRRLFGRPPCFWGGAGNTWSPEITFALGQLGVRAYAYALTAVPKNAPLKVLPPVLGTRLIRRPPYAISAPSAAESIDSSWAAPVSGTRFCI